MFICVWQKKGSDHKQAADLVQSNNEGFCKSDLKYQHLQSQINNIIIKIIQKNNTALHRFALRNFGVNWNNSKNGFQSLFTRRYKIKLIFLYIPRKF